MPRYIQFTPIKYYDPDGEFAAAAGALAWGAAVGGANVWNPVGWVILGVVAVAAVGYASYKIYQSSKSSKTTKKKTTKKSGKEKASDAPDWAKRQKYDPNKSADKNARDVLNKKYGKKQV